MGAADDLVAQAILALREITHPDEIAHGARETANEIEAAWKRTPLIAGFDGDLPARTELVNLLCGDKLLDPFGRTVGAAALRVRRGDRLRYRVLYSDRTKADRPIREPEDVGDFALGDRAEEVRTELATREDAQREAEAKLPVLVRERPAVWAFWLWIVRWILALAHRDAFATWRASRKSVAESRRKLAAIEQFAIERGKREQAAREKYFAELRAYASGGAAGEGIREVELEVPDVLPPGIELVEITGHTRAGLAADVVLTVGRDAISIGATVLGKAADVVPQLPEWLRAARASKLAQRARDRLQAARAELDVELSREELALTRRIEKVESLAVTMDRTRFVAVQLERVRPAMVASTNAVMEHASVHLGSELAQQGSEWINMIAKATTTDELKAAVAVVEEQWTTGPQRIAAEVRTLVMGGAAGVARDLYPDTVAELGAHGLPAEHLKAPKKAPVVGSVAILPSLASPSTHKLGSSWIGGLLKGFDAKKTEVREQVHARVEHLREVATAELLDAEPKLHAAIGQALAAELGRALDLQREHHAAALATERAAVDAERAKLAPLVASRNSIISRGVQLGHLTEAVAAPFSTAVT